MNWVRKPILTEPVDGLFGYRGSGSAQETIYFWFAHRLCCEPVPPLPGRDLTPLIPSAPLPKPQCQWRQHEDEQEQSEPTCSDERCACIAPVLQEKYTYASALKFAIENSWWELSRKRWQMASLAHVLTSSYHVHPTWDGEGTCTVFFMFLPAKGPFVTTHNPLMEWLHS